MAYFFFQAEDGIRDLTVTGVQTCALPISIRHTAHPTALAAHVPAVVRIEAPHQLARGGIEGHDVETGGGGGQHPPGHDGVDLPAPPGPRSEEHTSEIPPPSKLRCRLLPVKKKNTHTMPHRQHRAV